MLLVHVVKRMLHKGADFFKNQTVISILNDTVLLNKQLCCVKPEETLKCKDIILFLFTASWCPSCAMFLPKIKEIFELAEQKKTRMEIIYVNCEPERRKMEEYFMKEHGNWYALPYDSFKNKELHLRYNITYVPEVVALKHDGTIITKTGCHEIQEAGSNVLLTWSEN